MNTEYHKRCGNYLKRSFLMEAGEPLAVSWWSLWEAAPLLNHHSLNPTAISTWRVFLALRRGERENTSLPETVSTGTWGCGVLIAWDRDVCPSSQALRSTGIILKKAWKYFWWYLSMCNIWHAYPEGHVLVCDRHLSAAQALFELVSSPSGVRAVADILKRKQRKPAKRGGLKLKGCHSADSCQSFEAISQGCKVAKAWRCRRARLQKCLREKCWKSCQGHRYQRHRPESWNSILWKASHWCVLGMSDQSTHGHQNRM